jgi:RHS repeat-associated protein
LTRGLKNDPNLIYAFVRDHIEFTPIFGCVKGPEMTLLDGYGNDFDQVSLFVTLLREAGYTANYIYGVIRLSPAQITDWLGVSSDPDVVSILLGSAGIPAKIWVRPDGSLAYVDLDHVWAKVNIGGTSYVFAPSLKSHSSTAAINLQSAMGYDPGIFLAGASAGAAIQTDYVKDINTPNLTADLNSYSANLMNHIRENLPAAALKDVIGGRTIVPAATVPRQTSLPYQQSITYEWTEIPPAYKVSLRIQHRGIDVTVYSDQVYGRRLTIFYNASNRPVLALDGQTLATGSVTTPGTSQYISLTVNHPYAANGGTYCDDSGSLDISGGGSYFIVNGWANTDRLVIEQHRRVLQENRHAGGAEASEPVLGESLTVFGLTWLAECSRADHICDRIAETFTINHHTLGVCGYYASLYIDMPMSLCSVISNTNDSIRADACYYASSGHHSAFEWGMIEQLQKCHAVSTVKLIDMANTKSDKIFDANPSNWGTIRPHLCEYTANQLYELGDYIGYGCRIILPECADLGEDDWMGTGYIVLWPGSAIGHIISRGLHGGAGTTREPVDNKEAAASGENVEDALYKTDEPIDLLAGHYLYETTDLSVGNGIYPFSLGFGRLYNSSDALQDGLMGLGWTHTLNIFSSDDSDGFQGLGYDSPIDAVGAIVQSYVSIDLLGQGTANPRMAIATLSHRWFMDRLIDNVVTIDQPGNRLQFIKLPDGSYNPPPGEAAKLSIGPDGGYVLRTKHGDYLDFDPNGRITTWRDPNTAVSYSYQSGKLSQVSNQFGRSIHLAYDVNDANHVAAVTDSAGRVVHFGYDIKGNLTSITDANGFTTTFAYDPNNDGRITQIYYPTEPNNPYVTNVYDALGRVKTQTNANGLTYQYYYTGYRTEETDPCNYSTVYCFNDSGRLVTQTDQLGNQTGYQYDGQLRKTVVTQPRGNTTRYTYDGNHNVLQAVQTPVAGSGDPNIVETFNYEPNYNKVTTYTDPNGRISAFQYYANGKLRQIDQPAVDGSIPRTVFTYNSYGQIETVANPEGTVTKYEYDPSGNLTGTIVDYGVEPNKLNITMTMTYNAVGDVNSTTDPRGNKTRFEYDAMRRLVKATAPAPFNYTTLYEYCPDGSLKEMARETDDPHQWQVTSYTYTPSGKIRTVTDPNGDVTEYEYDTIDRLWKTTDAENNTTTRLYDAAGRLRKVIDANDDNSAAYSYNANGNIETLTDAKGNTSTYEYDGHNRLKKTIYPDATFEQSTYDLGGNISQKRTRGSQIIGYSYDPLNRLKTKTLPGPQQIQYAYDLTGRLKTVTDAAGTIRHSYDRAGRLVGVTYPDGKSISYQYDDGGNRLRLTYPDGAYISYDYDALNRLTCIRDPDGSVVAHYDYDALSRRTGAQFANGTSATYRYNIADRLLYLNNQMTGSSRSFAYSYDNVGNRLTMTTEGSTVHRYTYDKIYQLTKADYPAGYFAADTIFRYDRAGNRSAVISGGTTNYATNNLNQYTFIGGVAYSYDKNGNLTADGTNAYTYDAENRLVAAARTGSNVSYQYDPFGRRIGKNVNGATTKYLYDGDQIICEYDGSGILLRKFLYGTGIDETIRMSNVLPSANLTQTGLVDSADVAVLAGVWLLDINDASFNLNADLNSDDRIDFVDFAFLAGKWLTAGNRSDDYYYHYDGLGSVIALSNSTGRPTESYAYDTYGQANTTSTLGNPYLFTGRQFDPETGLYHYRARFCSPVVGRFLQPDPLAYLDGLNLYAYCFNDPVNWIDPFGLCKGYEELMPDEFHKKIADRMEDLERMDPYELWGLEDRLDTYLLWDSDFFYEGPEKRYKFEGEIYTGGELNYYVMGKLMKHRGLPLWLARWTVAEYKALRYFELRSSPGTWYWFHRGYYEHQRLSPKKSLIERLDDFLCPPAY